MKNKISGKKIFNLALALMIISIFAYLCLSENGLADLLKEARDFRKSWLVAAVACHLFNMLIDVFLVRILALQSIKNYRLKDAFKVSMVGQFFSAVTPSATGGQPMQVYTMSMQNIDVGVSTSVLTQKFLVYQTVLTVYGAVAILIRFTYLFSLDKVVWGLTLTGFAAQALVILTLLIFSFNKKFTHKIIVSIFKLLGKTKIIKDSDKKIANLEFQLEIFHMGNSELYKNRSLLIRTHVLTALQLASYFLIPYCIFKSFNLPSKAFVIDMICAQAFINMISWIVPLPGASGGAEAASAVFLSPFFDEKTIKSAVVVTRLISYYLTILISSPFSGFSKKRKV